MKPKKKLSEMKGILKTKISTRKLLEEIRSEWDEKLESYINQKTNNKKKYS